MGVSAGIGRHTGIDPVVFRVGFALLLLGAGIGLFVYIAAFLLMKEPNGRPGIIEQWTRRDFDADTVMALLTTVLACGLAINLATVWLDVGTLLVAVFLVVSLLAAHANGVDLRGLARSMPERLSRRRTEWPAPPYEPAPPAPGPAAARPVADPGPARPDEAVPPAGEAATPTIQHKAAAPQEHAEPREAVRDGEDADTQASEEQEHRPYREQQGQEDVSPEAVTAEHRVPPYQQPPPPPPQRPAHRPNPPTAVDYASHGEPFAPNGPYQPLNPARRPGGQPPFSPYDPVLYGRPIPRREPKRRPKSFIGLITILLALIIGGIVVVAQARSVGGVSPTIVGGAMLITIGAGLLIAAWWGRGAGLVAAGTTLTLIVSMGMMLGGVPRNVGPSEWAPTSIAESGRLYDVGVGDGTLDLSELAMPPGTSVTFNASVTVGELVVVVPPTARIEVHATNQVGDILLDQSLRGGVDVRVDEVLQPEIEPEGKLSTIVLNLKGGLGDMEVRRAA